MEELTTQQKLCIIENAHKSIINTINNLDRIKNYIDQITTWELMLSKIDNKISNTKYTELQNNLNALKPLLNLNLIISIINYDLKSAFSAALEKESKPEILFYARQFFQIVRESYRTVFGFKKPSEYLKAIEIVIKNFFPERLDEYNELIIQARRFDSQIAEISNNRNISIHYDQDPLKVYKMFLEMNINDIFTKYNPYIQTMHQVNDLINELIQQQAQNISIFLDNKHGATL